MQRVGRLPARIKLLATALLIGGGLLLLGPRLPYIFRVIWYQFAGIEDYQIFPARTVAASVGQPWMDIGSRL